MRHRPACLPIVLIMLVMAAPSYGAQPEPDEPQVIALTDALVLAPSGVRRRAATYTDALQAAMLDGDWSPPAAGDEVETPDGEILTWKTARAGDDGWLSHRGWALFRYDSPQERVLLLHARGHSMVYVNGEPRTGDPYDTGFVQVPVHVREGANTFLFSIGRGRLNARLVEPTRRVMLHGGDRTLPDLVAGEAGPWHGGMIILNNTTETLRDLTLDVVHARHGGTSTPLPVVPPLGIRKVGFRFETPVLEAGDGPYSLELVLTQPTDDGRTMIHDRAEISLAVRRAGDHQRRTFESEIDGSVQYYSVRPASLDDDPGDAPEGPLAMVLSLHGAGVEAMGQAGCYRSRPWCHVVAPTNRRPFGFDWEDWGRLDAIEVLGLAEHRLGTDPRRTYLTGHSMGGHGTWNLGATFPGRFAAIAPSAGWISFWSYGGAPEYDEGSTEQMLARARSGSDTLALSRNYLHQGVYILHGDRDDNVPVGQAREMRAHLGGYHPNFAYYERPGAGHWWGNECMDWPPLFEFLEANRVPETAAVRHVEFATASPGISPGCHWATIESQVRSGLPSRIDVRLDEGGRRFHGTTENVRRLAFDASMLEPAATVTVDLDGTTIELAWPHDEPVLRVQRDDAGVWAAGPSQPLPDLKGPHRCGPFKDAFRNRFILVYATGGTAEVNAWAYAKARYDAETFWYRGNGAADVVADSDFDRADPETADRSVILYGNADTNRAWVALLGSPPVSDIAVYSGALRIGERRLDGDDLACLFIKPRPGSDVASVAAVSGTGPRGMRLTDRLPYFVSGVGYPDVFVIGPEMLTRGTGGIRAAGFLGDDWSVARGEIAWRD